MLLRSIRPKYNTSDDREEVGLMVRYPVTLTQDDNDTILVTLPDFPEATTFGDDESEALAR